MTQPATVPSFFRGDENLFATYQMRVKTILAANPGMYETKLMSAMRGAGLRPPMPGEFRSVLQRLGASAGKKGRSVVYSWVE